MFKPRTAAGNPWPSPLARRHLERAQRGSWAGAGERRSQGLRTLYSLPAALCEELAEFAGRGAP